MSGRFRLESVLGRGRHASIWLAHDVERRERVAIKLARRGALCAERDALTALAGDGVVDCFGHGSMDDGRDWLAMPHLARATAKPLPLEGTEQLLTLMVRALADVHERGWVHRDLKPSHWLADGDRLVLCDFGCAAPRGTPQSLPSQQLVGTPRYAAAEQCQGAAAHPSADVYALGVCAFEMLAGRPPFPGQTLTELFSQHLRAPVPRLPREAAHWQPLVDAMLAKKPADRPVDGGALLHDMRHATGVTP